MIESKKFYEELNNNGIGFFTGVPDSLLKNICAYISDNTNAENNIITANEGAAVSLAAGYQIGSSVLPLVYMQNSGLGNAVNPLLSLADEEVYGIPMVLMIGWRGEPNVKDEPQHVKQGRITPAMLESMEIPYFIIDGESDYKSILKDARQRALNDSKPVALLVKKNTFAPYVLQSKAPDLFNMNREEALKEVMNRLPSDALVVSTTGMLSRELFELRETKGEDHDRDFLTVGSMGHTSQIALGLALANPEKVVYCFDGDGSVLMHLGSYAITGQLAPKNLRIVIFNNGAHDSVGGQPTVAQNINLVETLNGFGIISLGIVKSKEEIDGKMIQLIDSNQICALEIYTNKGSRKDLGRPTNTPKENKEFLQSYIQA